MKFTREHVVAVARDYVGTPFAHQGRQKGVGIDCAGLVIGVALDLQLSEYERTGYSRMPLGDDLRTICDKELIRRDTLALGCVALMRIARDPQHLAIVSDYPGGERERGGSIAPGTWYLVGERGPGVSLSQDVNPGDGFALIHAYASIGRCVEHRLDEAWRDRILALYDLPGIA